MAITFRYPRDLDHQDGRLDLRHVGAKAVAAREAVRIDRDDFLLIEKYNVAIPTTRANLPELEDAADQVVTGLFRREMTGARTRINGIPGAVYKPGPSGNGTTSQVSYVFLDGSAYELDCQWNARHKAAIKQACRQMKRTIKPAS
jgi:hypothetical protein